MYDAALSFNQEAGQSFHTDAAASRLPDDDLLDLVQKQTIKYFWDFAHPKNGMALERIDSSNDWYNTSETVTTGGTGFGIMALIAGAERGWIKRDALLGRLNKILDFVDTVEKHNGVLPHFIDSRTGKGNHFLESENGGNIVETAFFMSGLLTARQYFSHHTPEETALKDRINRLWEAIQWNSHQAPGNPNIQWLSHPKLGLGHWPVTGWNEAMITHILAAASPTHPVSSDAYEKGWASGQDLYKNGETIDGNLLPLGPPGGGPMFFAHYSFLGLDPRGLKDKHADYWRQNRSHTLANHFHCVSNPHNYKGYGPNCWGLTASDTVSDPASGASRYYVHHPKDDHGVISPTAALGSFPYTPKESMQALRYFYETMGDKIWGDCGFTDAFSEQHGWYAKTYLAIDQAPIAVMIENHRSGLLWNLFMSCPEVRHALDKLGFESPHLQTPVIAPAAAADTHQQPARPPKLEIA